MPGSLVELLECKQERKRLSKEYHLVFFLYPHADFERTSQVRVHDEEERMYEPSTEIAGERKIRKNSFAMMRREWEMKKEKRKRILHVTRDDGKISTVRGSVCHIDRKQSDVMIDEQYDIRRFATFWQTPTRARKLPRHNSSLSSFEFVNFQSLHRRFGCCRSALLTSLISTWFMNDSRTYTRL